MKHNHASPQDASAFSSVPVTRYFAGQSTPAFGRACQNARVWLVWFKPEKAFSALECETVHAIRSKTDAALRLAEARTCRRLGLTDTPHTVSATMRHLETTGVLERHAGHGWLTTEFGRKCDELVYGATDGEDGL